MKHQQTQQELLRVRRERLALATTYGIDYREQASDVRAVERAESVERLTRAVRT